jgi:hypothetical protein
MKPVDFKTANTPEQLKTTIRLIGQAIQKGSLYLPIRHLAGRAASTAPPKNYYAQIRAIYHAITTQWWRYTFDPKGAEVLTIAPEQIFQITLGHGKNNHQGYGDCDDVTIASGALLASIGFDIRIATTVKPGSPFIFDHVFCLVKPTRNGNWMPFDPVLFPRSGCGDITKFKRIAIWDLNGNLVSKSGPFPPRFDSVMHLYGSDQPAGCNQSLTGTEGMNQMNTQLPNYYQFPDQAEAVGLFGADDIVADKDLPRLHRDDYLPDFARHGIVGFGAYGGVMGSMTGAQLPQIMAEYDQSDEIGDTGFVRTKHFELAPDDYQYVKINGTVPHGALALADDGEVYQWAANPEGIGGFFKKLFRRAKKGFKRIGRGIRRVARGAKRLVKKFVKKLPMGKMLWKIGSKIHSTAMKIVKPLMKVVGPIAKKIAPIAALIPGIGPAVSAGLMITGKVYDIAKKYGVKFDKAKRPLIKSKAQGRAFATALAKAGQRMGKKGAKAAIDAYKRKKGGSGGHRRSAGSLISPDFMGLGDSGIYAAPDVNNFSRMPAYHGIGWV